MADKEPKKFTYVIEHMEEDEPDDYVVPEWALLEYNHMLSLASPTAIVRYTNLSPLSSSALPPRLSTSSSTASADCHTSSILDVLKEHGVPLERVCLLDPRAEKEIAPEDGEEFDWFLFGGILGDEPPRDRTAELRKLGFKGRHLGPKQMTTDTALGVTKLVVHDKIPLSKIPFVTDPTIRFANASNESIEMPFRYIANERGEPVMPPGMREHLWKDLDRAFEF